MSTSAVASLARWAALAPAKISVGSPSGALAFTGTSRACPARLAVETRYKMLPIAEGVHTVRYDVALSIECPKAYSTLRSALEFASCRSES